MSAKYLVTFNAQIEESTLVSTRLSAYDYLTAFAAAIDEHCIVDDTSATIVGSGYCNLRVTYYAQGDPEAAQIIEDAFKNAGRPVTRDAVKVLTAASGPSRRLVATGGIGNQIELVSA